jgi:putative membrane protein
MMNRALLITLFVVVAITASCAGCAGWHHGPHMGDGEYGMFIMWIVGLLVLLVLGLVIYFLVYVLQRQGPRPGTPETPLDILKKRHARGEITRAEFEERKRDLES